MKLFRRKVSPAIQKAHETVEEAQKATTEASAAVQKYWAIRRQYAKVEAQRRHK